MDDLVTWLRAQLDEDEQVARGAGWHRWEHGAGDRIVVAPDNGKIVAREWRSYDAQHAVRWDPARVLAEVDAKRRILDWCTEVIGDRDLSRYNETGSLASDPSALAVTLAVETVRLLALPMADRPGYDESWKP